MAPLTGQSTGPGAAALISTHILLLTDLGMSPRKTSSAKPPGPGPYWHPQPRPALLWLCEGAPLRAVGVTSASCSPAGRPAKLLSGDSTGSPCRRAQFLQALPSSSRDSKPKPSSVQTCCQVGGSDLRECLVFCGTPGILGRFAAMHGRPLVMLLWTCMQRTEKPGRFPSLPLPLLLLRGPYWQTGGKGEPLPPLQCQGRRRSQTWRRRCRC